MWRQDVQMSRSVQASQQLHSRRSRLFLEIEERGVSGFGEIAPQPYLLNGDAGIDEVVDEVRAWIVAQLSDCVNREGGLPAWSRVARWAGPRAASNPAVALVEMALLDRELNLAATAIEQLWVPIAETPLQGTGSLIGAADWTIAQNIARLRLKVEPGVLPVATLDRLAQVDVPVLLDFNCSANEDSEVIDIVQALSGVCEVIGVEQPFAAGNVVEHARLAERLDVAVSIDEGVRSPRDIDQIVRYRAAQIICIKPARVGGLANSRTMIARAKELGLRVYLGGFFESPFARRVHRALANQAILEPSDLGTVHVAGLEYFDEVMSVDSGFGLRPSPQLLERSRVIALSL